MVSDSTLTWNGKPRAGVLKTWRPNADFRIQGGATAKELEDLLAGHHSREVPVIILWNLNDLLASRGAIWKVAPVLSEEFMARLGSFARTIKQFRRALVVVGGFAEMWDLDPI